MAYGSKVKIIHTPRHGPRLSTFIKSSEQLNHLVQTSCFKGCSEEILCCPNKILSCSGEILSCRNKLIMLCGQDIMLSERDIKLFRRDIMLSERDISCSDEIKVVGTS